jgi:phosphogluconate dehydratase
MAMSCGWMPVAGTLQALVDAGQWRPARCDTMPEALVQANGLGMGRELFAGMRRNALSAEEGACTWL